MADACRGLTISLGGICLALAITESMKFWFRWRKERENRNLFMAFGRLGSALGVFALVIGLGTHLGEPFTYRIPLYFAVFACVLISVLGIARED